MCLIGYLHGPYCKLIERLGQPESGDGYKVDAEWVFEICGQEVSVYNYKDGPAHLGDSGTPVEQIRLWHVGADSDDVLQSVGALLDQPVWSSGGSL